MSDKKLAGILCAATGILLALVFLHVQTAWAGQNGKSQSAGNPSLHAGAQAAEKQSAATPAKAPAAEQESTATRTSVAQETSSGGGAHEGIKVHGHWTIDIRNPDGTLVTHREFENSIAPVTPLPSFLSRSTTVGFWGVLLDATSGTRPCQSATTSLCGIYESAFPAAVSGTTLQYNNLQLSEGGVNPANSVLASQLVLTGTATALASSGINQVSTVLTTCANTVAPANAGPSCGGVYGFTGTTLATPISVSPGQIIQVKVVISFS